jgi:hypothetical protein
MAKAWAIARAGAKRFGGTVRSYLAAALRSVWAEEKAARAAIAAMKARVRASIASLPADLRDMEQRLQRWYAANESRPSAEVVPLPGRRPVVPAIPAAARAA